MRGKHVGSAQSDTEGRSAQGSLDAAGIAAGPHIAVFVVAPLVAVVAVSFLHYDNFAVIPAFTLENYQSVLTSRLTLSLYLTMIRLAALPGSARWWWDSALLISWCSMSAAN